MAKQQPLDLGERPALRFRKIDIADIDQQGFGSPPEPELIRSVGISGVFKPVLLRENGDGRFLCRDGKRRVLAAKQNELTSVPAMVLVGGNPDLFDHAMTLEANDTSSSNPVIELESIEEMMRQAKEQGLSISAPGIAKATGIKLKTVRGRLKLTALRWELREAWKNGLFGTKVGEKAAGCDEMQQAELLRRLEAAGDTRPALTMKDISEVKRIGVSEHQRQLPDDRRVPRAIEMLEQVRDDLWEEFPDGHAALTATEEALEALRAEAE